MTKKIFILIVILSLFILNGCFVLQIQENVKYPSRVIEKAKNEIQKIHEKYPERKHIAHKLNLLVYDGESRDLIRISAPMWLVELILKMGLKHAKYEIENSTSSYFDIDWSKFTNLSELGPGLLLEVEDLEENTSILIWLE
ncbi:hypothetical protein NLC82_04155 [Candidatus Aminicenantes bacterium AC-335-A11]|jgi:hypothetical protein|nr:hypothetical protein [SCandidatus Aminicenantes bacterium Aminicenantia_JdfR_composite]MCP2598346.1 hypothetical protein [Candidatus Aminicenantes bacterium AC-335-L06]MCP2618594.1 hypothetical protein [Candidatus Aminicenantes bacterium AC-335-A11]MCP2621058.1 hypothetical protein [Candidatus Aminicenantes bacterium AC-334-E05]